jgi:hypothetical protein
VLPPLAAAAFWPACQNPLMMSSARVEKLWIIHSQKPVTSTNLKSVSAHSLISAPRRAIGMNVSTRLMVMSDP